MDKRATFEQTCLPHLNAAYNLARWMTGNAQDAEDIVQEAYLRAFRYFDGFRGGDGKTWLLAIVRNTCLTWRQREGQAAKVAFNEETHGTKEAADPVDYKLGERLRTCIELLPADYRETLVMRELEDMPYKDIAEAQNVPIGTVMSRLARARKRLMDCVKAHVEGVGR